MTCSRIITTMGSGRRRSIRTLIGTSTTMEGTSKQGICGWSNAVKCTTKQTRSLSSADPCRDRSSLNRTRQFSSRSANRREKHTHATANPLVTGKKKATASGWQKPVVSSSLSLSSYVDPKNPREASASTIAERISISLSSPLETNESVSENTVGVDMEELLQLASKKTTPLSLKDMYKYAIVDAENREQRIRNAQFLHSE